MRPHIVHIGAKLRGGAGHLLLDRRLDHRRALVDLLSEFDLGRGQRCREPDLLELREVPGDPTRMLLERLGDVALLDEVRGVAGLHHVRGHDVELVHELGAEALEGRVGVDEVLAVLPRALLQHLRQLALSCEAPDDHAELTRDVSHKLVVLRLDLAREVPHALDLGPDAGHFSGHLGHARRIPVRSWDARVADHGSLLGRRLARAPCSTWTSRRSLRHCIC